MNIINGNNNNVFSNINNSQISIGNNMWKSQIQQLVGQGRLKEAIALYVLNNGEGATLLSGRFHENERSKNLGTISNSDYNMEYNKISHALLSYIGVDSSYQAPQKVEMPIVSSHEVILLQIVKDKRRRDDKVADEAQSLLDELTKHNQEKKVNPSYDVAGRRYLILETKINKFIKEVQESKLDSLEQIVNRISVLLAGIPSYEFLNEAYKLAQGRGFTSEYCDRNLHNRPEDDEVKITIAEKIENFIATINVK